MKNRQSKLLSVRRFIILIFSFNILIHFGFSQSKTTISTITPSRSVEECRKLVLEKGDSIAYYDLFFALDREGFGESYLFYSLYMAKKFNYIPAYYYAYESIVSFYERNNIVMDEQTLNLALNYLELGAKNNDKNALIHLGTLYLKGQYLNKDTIKGKELYSKGWGISVEKLKPFWR